MGPITLTITFHIDEPMGADDLDEISAITREAVQREIGISDYTIEDITGFDIAIELQDE